jgi:hypothetical protein
MPVAVALVVCLESCIVVTISILERFGMILGVHSIYQPMVYNIWRSTCILLSGDFNRDIHITGRTQNGLNQPPTTDDLH